MPANPHKNNFQSRVWIKKILSKVPDQGIPLNTLIFEAITQFPVSEDSIKKFVYTYYIEPGILTEVEGILYANKTT